MTNGTEWRTTSQLAILAALATIFGPGCGGMLQAAYGFSEVETRPAVRTRTVRLEGVPAGAVVERTGPDGTRRLVDPTRDEVVYAVSETVDVPRSRVPMYVGTALDVVGLGASIYAAAKLRDSAKSGAVYSTYFFGTGAVADGIFAAIYSQDTDPKVRSFEPTGEDRVSYTARLGDETRVAALDPAWGQSIRFDFDTPSDAIEPGGPRPYAVPTVQPPAPPGPLALTSPPPAPPVERWYGWQIMSVDALAIGGFVYALKKDNSALAWGSVALYAAGPPLIHFAHGQYARGGGSFAGRAAAPFLGGGVGGLVGLFAGLLGDCRDPDCPLTSMGVGAAIGAGLFAAAAPIVDSGFLAWKPMDDDGTEEAPSLTLVPSPGATDDGHMTLGIGGRF